MTTNSVHATIQENVDPVLEAIIHGLVESRLHPESQQQPGQTVTTALAQALLASMARQTAMPPQPQLPELQIPPLVQALASALSATLASTLAATVAPALAAALSPALANTLAPAIVEGLTKTEQAGQRRPKDQQGQQHPQERQDQQEQQGQHEQASQQQAQG
jgi:hypothetical protein